jgi:hypothetical protein
VEEPSTASKTDARPAANILVIRSPRGAGE